MPPLRLAYLVNQYPKTSHTFIRREIAALESRGIEVERFTIRRTREELVDPQDRKERDRTHVILDEGPIGLALSTLTTLLLRPIRFAQALVLAARIGRRSERGLLRHLAYLAEACVLRRWLSGREVRHLHAHFSTNATAVAMLTFVLGGPEYSFTCHGGEELDTLPYGGLSHKVGRARFVVTASQFVRAQVMRLCRHEDWCKLHVVRCTVDEGYLASECSPPPSAPRVVCIGRLCREKMQLLLIQAAARLRREGIRFEVVLVGDGDMRAAIEHAVDVECLRDVVRLTGWASGEEVRRQIDAARVVVLPSAIEGLPVACMEALAAGRPVISTYVAGIPELVRPGENGWLVPPGDVSALADAIRQSLEADDAKLQAMGLAGRCRVEQLHNPRIEAARLCELFQSGWVVSPGDLPQVERG